MREPERPRAACRALIDRDRGPFCPAPGQNKEDQNGVYGPRGEERDARPPAR